MKTRMLAFNLVAMKSLSLETNPDATYQSCWTDMRLMIFRLEDKLASGELKLPSDNQYTFRINEQPVVLIEITP